MNDLLIVDDEQPVLQSLSAALDWSEYGFSRILTAKGPEEAVSLLQNHMIDLVILDIQMPGMSGLELLRLIRSRYPGTHCILISAHSKFEYAKEALLLNVENYLLKPIDINELRETVSRAADNISRAASDSRNLFARNLLERWLHGRISTDELVEHSRYTEYNVLMRRYIAIAIYLHGESGILLHRLKSEFLPETPAYPLVISRDNGVLLVGGQDLSEDLVREAAFPLTKSFPKCLIICGSTATGSADVSRSLADANHALAYARFAGFSGFLTFSEIDRPLLSPEQLVTLGGMLQLPPQRKQILSFADSLANGNFDAVSCRNLFGCLYAEAVLAMQHMLEMPELLPDSVPPLPLPQGREQFREAFADAVVTLGSSRTESLSGLSPIIRRVVSYIRDNMTGAVSIKQCCEQTGMNPTYIGRLFKEELGMYFSEYVSFLRISRAKMLLETTNLPVGDIARQVGMYDVSYFVQCFKKQERTSPMKYRQAVAMKKQE